MRGQICMGQIGHQVVGSQEPRLILYVLCVEGKLSPHSLMYLSYKGSFLLNKISLSLTKLFKVDALALISLKLTIGAMFF